MGYTTKSKDPDAVLDYQWVWTADLGDDTIDSAVFDVYTADGEEIPETDATPVNVDSFSNTTTTATAFLSGGTLNHTYLIVCHVVTAGGREDDKTLKLRITQK